MSRSALRTLGVAAAIVGTLVLRAAATPDMPERLSQTGLFLPGTTTVAPQNRPFAPQYPLWTDGAHKRRWIHVPPGAQIDARDADAWDLPVGTRFWKELAFGGRRLETRMLWRSGSDTWSYAAYVWNEAQTDAVLAPPGGVRNVAEIAPGRRHTVPSRDDCRACHENGSTPVLGFTALQLSDDRDPSAPHAEPLAPDMLTLGRLVAERVLHPIDPRLAVVRPRVPGDARTRAALGYLSANCGHCHNERSNLATVQFPLRMPAFASEAHVRRVLESLTSRTTKWDLPHSTPGTTALIAPGAPDLSALVARMRSRRPSSQMPPLGTVVSDQTGVALISNWIAETRF